MIAAASQTLAELIAEEVTQVSLEQISFAHPRLWQKNSPGLNLYCYNVQESGQPSNSESNSECRWFDLTFLVSVADYTTLGEQKMLSEVLGMLSQYPLLPNTVLDRTLQGYGTVNMKVFTQAMAESILFWAVLCAPFQLALHVTLTVPYPLPNQAVLLSHQKLRITN
jgi:Pvc16 N-terminal domain